MKILSVDFHAASLDWLMRCKEDGHVVKMFSSDPKTIRVGEGMIDRVDDFHKWLRWADVVFVADNVKWMRDLDAARRDGVPIFGPSAEMSDLELDRDKGMEVFRQHKISTIDTTEFNDYNKAIDFVKKTMGRYVSKPSGDADKALSYCSKSPEDMVFMLQRWKKLAKMKSPFILQKFVPGCEMAVGAWVGKNGFASVRCENWEFKKLMDGDMGVATGEQGTVLRYVKASKLAQRVLDPLEEYMVDHGYIGYIDVNCIVDDEGNPWPLEFTCRPGWPTFNIQQVLHNGDHAEWLVDLIEGRDPKCWTPNSIVMGVVLSIPDYPYSRIPREDVQNIPIYGMTPSLRPNIHPCEVMMGRAPVQVAETIVDLPIWVTAGDYVLVATGEGETVREAKHQAYRVMKRLSLPNSPMYRTDIGDRLKTQIEVLQKHGYATGMVYRKTDLTA